MMTRKQRPLIGQLFIEGCGLTTDALDEALLAQKDAPLNGNGSRIGDLLISAGKLTERQVLESLCLQWEVPFSAQLNLKEVDATLTEKVPIAFAKRNLVLPLCQNAQFVQIATNNPLNLAILDDLRLLLGRGIEVVAAPSDEILRGIHALYERAADSAEKTILDIEGDNMAALATIEQEDLLDANSEAPMIRLVNSILFQAVSRRASDIHIEPFERELVVRYRIDGLLYLLLTVPKRFQSAFLSRVKIMAGMDIAEKRLPQDGRIGLRVGGREIDIRVADIPTAHGERLVLRILDKSTKLFELPEIGFQPEDLAAINRLISLAHGILLVTGPTGSGKTTTLYACLNKINSIEKNIITIEDPIEYQLHGVGQIQVNPKIDLSFANGLRSILRQDPDVIMVGEIRDVETAEIAIHASLTGHMVFSTLHTNDSAGAITRLLDMGIEPFLVTSSIVGIIAQRLVRLICKNCTAPHSMPPHEIKKLSATLPKDTVFYKGQGCDACMHTGYFGRSSIYEILHLDDDIRKMVLNKVDAGQIKAKAIAKGMKALREEGARRVAAGLTTAEEVLRVTQDEIV